MWTSYYGGGVQQVDHRCMTCRLRIQKGIPDRERTKQDDFLFDSWEEVTCRVCRRRLELLLSWFESPHWHLAHQKIRRGAVLSLCKTNIEMRILRHTVAGRR